MMNRSSSRQIVRAPRDVSLALKPATSFAHLRSFNRNLMRGDTMTSHDVRPKTHDGNEAAARSRRRRGHKRRAHVNPVMAKHFPMLGPDHVGSVVVKGSGGGSGAESPGFSPREQADRSAFGRSGSAPGRRSRAAHGGTGLRQSRGRSTLGKSASRLFDPRLTSSAMEEIDWLPKFRRSISRVGMSQKKKSGGFGIGKMSGTLKLRSTKSVPLPDDRPAFIPSGGAAAKKAIQADMHGFHTVGTPYDTLYRQQLEEKTASKAKRLAGEFRRSKATDARKLVMVESYLNSPDEEALIAEREWIREKTLLSTAEFAAKKIGRAPRHRDVAKTKGSSRASLNASGRRSRTRFSDAEPSFAESAFGDGAPSPITVPL